MKYAISQYCGRGQQQPDGLIAMEGFALVFAACSLSFELIVGFQPCFDHG